ncbi:fructosamine kinase family protein, partial [Providencia stuartii]
IFDGYQSIWPLSEKFLSRQPIYQLYYFLNRCHLFGEEKDYLAARKIIDDLLGTH